MQNLNKNNLENLNTKYIQDFNTALSMYEIEYTDNELIEFLKKGSIVEKQIATLKLSQINSKENAEIFINNLTGCDGKIREAVSFRLKEFISQNPHLYTNFYDKFLDAIIDINGNICRNTISALTYMKEIPEFTINFCEKLCSNTLKLAKKAITFDLQDGKYKINKEIFKLYWYLETLFEFSEYINIETITTILNLTTKVHDYTIREKSAKIISKMENSEHLQKIREKLRQDENYYVRRF